MVVGICFARVDEQWVFLHLLACSRGMNSVSEGKEVPFANGPSAASRGRGFIAQLARWQKIVPIVSKPVIARMILLSSVDDNSNWPPVTAFHCSFWSKMLYVSVMRGIDIDFAVRAATTKRAIR